MIEFSDELPINNDEVKQESREIETEFNDFMDQIDGTRYEKEEWNDLWAFLVQYKVMRYNLFLYKKAIEKLTNKETAQKLEDEFWTKSEDLALKGEDKYIEDLEKITEELKYDFIDTSKTLEDYDGREH